MTLKFKKYKNYYNNYFKLLKKFIDFNFGYKITHNNI